MRFRAESYAGHFLYADLKNLHNDYVFNAINKIPELNPNLIFKD